VSGGRVFTSPQRLAQAYPETPMPLAHGLSGHPSFTRAALLALAERMRPADISCCRGDVPVAVGPAGAPETGRAVAETIESLERCGAWVVLKYVEQDPLYRALLDGLLAEIAPWVCPRTGPMLQPEAFIFLSSPGAVTPFHFDPEHNILMQVEGRKAINVLPAGDDRITSGIAHELYHAEGRNGLEWRDDLAGLGRTFALAPGGALYVPVKAPHWVRNGDEVSISFSITWRSGWSLREGYAHGFNRILRGAGLTPRPPRRFPRDNHAKALAYQCFRKGRQLVGVRG
jgi:hypothetical protein